MPAENSRSNNGAKQSKRRDGSQGTNDILCALVHVGMIPLRLCAKAFSTICRRGHGFAPFNVQVLD
jgi:hypothetical protein